MSFTTQAKVSEFCTSMFVALGCISLISHTRWDASNPILQHQYHLSVHPSLARCVVCQRHALTNTQVHVPPMLGMPKYLCPTPCNLQYLGAHSSKRRHTRVLASYPMASASPECTSIISLTCWTAYVLPQIVRNTRVYIPCQPDTPSAYAMPLLAIGT